MLIVYFLFAVLLKIFEKIANKLEDSQKPTVVSIQKWLKSTSE